MFSSHYFCGHLLLATKQSYLLMSTQISVEISACTEANMAWILVQEQLEAKDEMLAYWPSYRTETKDLHISETMTYWTRQQQYFSLWPICLVSTYIKYSGLLSPIESQFLAL